MNRRLLLVPAVVAALGVSACQVQPPAVGHVTADFAGCKAFSAQPDAQRAWEQAGSPRTNDRDGDGIVCTSLNRSSGGTRAGAGVEGDKPGCKRTDRIVEIGLSSTKHKDVLAHAVRAGKKGYGTVMSDSPYPVWVINRKGASERRAKLLQGIPTKPGMDRDEAAPAMARASWKADVEYVESSQNRSAGSVMGIKLRRFCSGTKFRYIGY